MLGIQREEFDHIFTDAELQDLLSKVAEQGGHEEGGALTEVFADAAGAVPLQFMPPPLAATSVGDLSGTSGPPSSSVLNAGYPDPMAALQAQQASLHMTAPQLLPPGLAALPSPPPPFATSLAPARSAKATSDKPHVSHSTVEKQRRDRINSLIDELRELVPPSKAALAAGQPPGVGGGAGARDANANSEARRPKHVVLADTIALLKQLQLKQGPLAALLSGGPLPGRPSADGLPPGSPPAVANGVATAGGAGAGTSAAQLTVKEEGGGGGAGGGAGGAGAHHLSPSNSNSKGSVSSHEDMEMKEDGTGRAPKLPHIPIQPTQLAGVVVERGPDCMYVQVKCRDRKGLLVDIINALKQLPLEVRTAAVTTTPEGLVRDVFEVCVDDAELQPADVQNMVHEALFQKWPSDTNHKRSRN